MTDSTPSAAPRHAAEDKTLSALSLLLLDQKERWQRGECPMAEAYLAQHPSLHHQVEAWIVDDVDPDAAGELQALLDAGDDAELADRFSGPLSFGITKTSSASTFGTGSPASRTAQTTNIGPTSLSALTVRCRSSRASVGRHPVRLS